MRGEPVKCGGMYMLYEIVNEFPNKLLHSSKKPCISLYQPIHRHGLENQKNPILFKNLTKQIEQSLSKKYKKEEVKSLMKPLEQIAMDRTFWQYAGEGLAIFATEGNCIVYRLQRPVKELAVVADTFHIKPLIRVFQSADRYHLLGLNRDEFALFEGNRYSFEKIEIDPSIPQTRIEALGEEEKTPALAAAVSGSGGESVYFGHGSKREEVYKDIDRFFRYVDRTVFEHFSNPMKLPLFLVALDEYHTPFQKISNNPYLQKEGIKIAFDAVSEEKLKELAWEVIEPIYLEKTRVLVDRYESARARGKASEHIEEVAQAAISNRIECILIESDRMYPGKVNLETGAIEKADLNHPEVDDLLDDLAEIVFKNNGEVVVLPKERMPSDTGVAAIYRY